MGKVKQEFLLSGIELDPTSSQPLYQQLYDAFRVAILEKRLRSGQRLPATREIATQFNVSRSTVLLAFDHLHTEGYILGKTGAGTFVNENIPDDFFQANPNKSYIPVDFSEADTKASLSTRAKRIQASMFPAWASERKIIPFRPGIPALREFPFDLWAKLVAKATRNLPISNYGYQPPAGYRPLREAIADYLRRSRMLKCEASQVIIVSGSQQALDLIARVTLNPGDKVWVEDPGYAGVKQALSGAGTDLIPVPVDDEGLVVAKGKVLCPEAKLIYVTPSHQYPLGIHMSLERRIELLNWAKQQNAWIIEDDYDSEYRYVGRPISALQGIDQHERVLYVGTFSKVLFPALRLGYLVVSPALVDAFIAAKAMIDRASPIIPQAALTSFIEEGHFGRHIRRMRLLYESRQQCLIDSIKVQMGDAISIKHAEAGLHLTADLNLPINASHLAKQAFDAGIYIPAVSDCCMKASLPQRVIMGYAAYEETEIKGAVKRLEKILR